MSLSPFKRNQEFQSVDDFSALLETLGKVARSDTPNSSPKEPTTERVAHLGAIIIAPILYVEAMANRFEARFIEPPTYSPERMTTGQIKDYCMRNDGGLTVKIADSWKV